jgi:hypothetical protein
MRMRREQGSQVKEVRDRLAQVGVCVECHWRLARPDRLMCWTCSYRINGRRREMIRYQGKKRCGNCRRKGHDRRTCRNKATADLRE